MVSRHCMVRTTYSQYNKTGWTIGINTINNVYAMYVVSDLIYFYYAYFRMTHSTR